MDRKGATALGTGGNGGLRRRICRALAKEGVHIAVMYAQNRDRAESVARELTSRHLARSMREQSTQPKGNLYRSRFGCRCQQLA
jgi:NAD(P)-dependent dehydrogenase (short-subunit alcohol dehydrogenase family)